MAGQKKPPVMMEWCGLANRQGPAPIMAHPHRHNEVELNFVEGGSMTYLFGGRRETVYQGQLALFWAIVPHQTVEVEGETILYWLTIPSATFLQWNLPEILVQPIVSGAFVSQPLERQQATVHGERLRQWQTDLFSDSQEHRKIVLLEVEACLRRLALSLHGLQPARTAWQQRKGAPHAIRKVEQIACFIADHYTDPLRIEDVAACVHVHPNYAMSLFRSYFGLSILEYITQYRIAHAQRLLITSDTNISEIALEAGFGSLSRFYSVFKAICGQLPGEYRSSHQGCWS
jgi:AraC-like DNA-binding protein